MTYRELNLAVGELSPALDDFVILAFRNAIDDVTDLETRRLQG